VTAAVVVDVVDPRLGEILYAAVSGSDPGAIDVARLRNRCFASLPAQMIPVYLMALSSIPQTATGKTDRNAARMLLRADNEKTN